MFLAVRNLVQDRQRLLLSVVGVALSLMLVMLLLGLRAGVFRTTVAYLDHAPGSVVVLPQGVRSTGAGSGQFLAPATTDAVASTPGVARVAPILLTMAFAEPHGTKEIIKLVGYDASLGGGPWALARGREPRADDEIVIDGLLAKRHGLEIGDAFALGGRELTVVGLSSGTSSWTGNYAFARKTVVESLVLAPGSASFLLVAPAGGTRPADTVAKLRNLPGTNVLLKSAVMANDQEIVAGIFDKVILLMVAAAFVVGALVVGMVIYTSTIERQSEYGVMKAIGARNSVLYRLVAWQALIAAGLGSVLAVGFAFIAGWLTMAAKPQFLVVIEPSAITTALGAGLVMALAGALLPARVATRLAPADVFRR